ncbi:MAG TPA: ABC transporter permease, partial [Alphaproteobacteria bacterium]|nr:ABC transporter permease [Alphaproteobacteria bacterium]
MSGDRAPSLRLRQTLRSGRVLVGGGIVTVILLCAVFAPLLAPHDPGDQDLLANLLPPAFMDGGNPDYLLGTDSLGRDILSRLIYGSRVAMFVAVFAAFFAMLLGGTMALLAGYFGGRVDWLISRTVDAWMSFPPVILSVILMVGLGVGLINVVL